MKLTVVAQLEFDVSRLSVISLDSQIDLLKGSVVEVLKDHFVAAISASVIRREEQVIQ